MKGKVVLETFDPALLRLAKSIEEYCPGIVDLTLKPGNCRSSSFVRSSARVTETFVLGSVKVDILTVDRDDDVDLILDKNCLSINRMLSSLNMCIYRQGWT